MNRTLVPTEGVDDPDFVRLCRRGEVIDRATHVSVYERLNAELATAADDATSRAYAELAAAANRNAEACSVDRTGRPIRPPPPPGQCARLTKVLRDDTGDVFTAYWDCLSRACPMCRDGWLAELDHRLFATFGDCRRLHERTFDTEDTDGAWRYACRTVRGTGGTMLRIPTDTGWLAIASVPFLQSEALDSVEAIDHAAEAAAQLAERAGNKAERRRISWSGAASADNSLSKRKELSAPSSLTVLGLAGGGTDCRDTHARIARALGGTLEPAGCGLYRIDGMNPVVRDEFLRRIGFVTLAALAEYRARANLDTALASTRRRMRTERWGVAA